MKKLAAIFLCFCSALVFGNATDMRYLQRNLTDTGDTTRIIPFPAGGADGIFWYNGTTVLPDVLTLGTNLSITGGVLNAASGGVQADWTANSGPSQILNKPTFATVAFSGNYGDLSSVPTNLSAFTNGPGYITGINSAAVTTALGYTPYNASNPDAYITAAALSPYLTSASAASTYATQSALTSGLSGKFNTPSGSTVQYVRGDGTLAAFPTAISTFTNDSAYITQAGARTAISLTTTGTSGAASYNNSTGVLNIPNYAPGTGTVTSVTAGTGLSGGTFTTTGTISMPNTGTAGTYSGVTTDAQGRVTAGTTMSINDAPGRSLVTTTSSTGFQISSTRIARGCYEGSFATTSTIGGPASASVFLETADTNSTTPGDWTTKAQQTYTNNITLAVVLNQQQGNNWSFCRDIPAGKYVRIRSGSITGTASTSINSTQQETTY